MAVVLGRRGKRKKRGGDGVICVGMYLYPYSSSYTHDSGQGHKKKQARAASQ